MLVSSLISAIPSLANVFLLCLFFFAIFGIVGLQLFGGTLHNRCFSRVNSSAVGAVAEGLGEAALLEARVKAGGALEGLAMIHESEVVCGGDWMCMSEAELEGYRVPSIAGNAAPCSCTPLWESSGVGSVLHACEMNGPARARFPPVQTLAPSTLPRPPRHETAPVIK